MIKALARALLSLTALPLTLANPVMAKPATLEPIGNWTMLAGKDSCLIQRTFGDASRPSIIQLQRFAPGDRFILTAASDDLQSLALHARVAIQYDGLNVRKEILQVMRGEVPQAQPAPPLPMVTMSSVLRDEVTDEAGSAPTVTPEAERTVTGVTFAWEGRKLTFNTGSLGQPLSIIRRCTDNLLRSWGLDPAIQTALSRRPQPKTPPGNWLRMADFPPEMLISGQQGYVQFRLLIDANGQPTNCTIQASVFVKGYDEVTCARIMARARFKPAIDAQGQTVASYYANSVQWMIPF